MNKFEIFSKKNIGKLSAAIRDDRSVWFLAKDVAEILGMQAKNALRMLDDSDKEEVFTDIGNGRRKYHMEYATYQTTPEIHGEGTFFFTDCGHKMYSNRDKTAYHGCLCPGCFSQGKMTTLYLRGSEEGNRYWKKKLEEKS